MSTKPESHSQQSDVADADRLGCDVSSADSPAKAIELNSKDQTIDINTTLLKEIGGVKGPEPTRYGDWEHKGRCYDF